MAITFQRYNGSEWINESEGGSTGSSNHASLTNLDWLNSKHTGTHGKLASFDSEGNASYSEGGFDSLSGGMIYPEPVFTDNGDGSFNISAGEANLFDNANFEGAASKYSIDALSNEVLTDGITCYLVADYNSGSPIYKVITDVLLITESDVVPVQTLYRSGTAIINLSWDALGSGLSNKLHARFVKTDRFARQSGLGLSEFGTRNLLIDEGIIWNGATSINTDEVNTTIDPFCLWYHNAGVWTQDQTPTAYNNTQYDDGTNLQTLGNNKYVVNWIYRQDGEEARACSLLSDEMDKLADAQAAQPPASVPDVVGSHAFLVGRVIVKKGENTGEISSAFDIHFSSSGAVVHNDTTEKQGGTAGEYYHLTAAEKTVVENTSGTNTGDQSSGDFDHNSLVNTHNLTTDIPYKDRIQATEAGGLGDLVFGHTGVIAQGVGWSELGQSFTLDEETTLGGFKFKSAVFAQFTATAEIYAGQTNTGTALATVSATSFDYDVETDVVLDSAVVLAAGQYSIIFTQTAGSMMFGRPSTDYSGGKLWSGFVWESNKDFWFEVYGTGEVVTNSLIIDGTKALTTGNLQATGTVTGSNLSGTNTGDITVTDTASVDLTLTGQDIKADVLPAGVDHDQTLNYVANQHINWTNATDNIVTTGTVQGGATTVNGTLTVVGDISQTGSTYETHAEQLYTTKDLIMTRDGAVGGLGAGEYTGFQAEKYDGTNDGQLVFDAQGWARVGDVGSLQKLATIEETSIDQGFAYYDNASLELKTKLLASSDISDFDTEVSNNTDVAANTSSRHNAVTISDTSSINLSLSGQQVSGVVLPAGVNHNSLNNYVANEHIDWTSEDAGTIDTSNMPYRDRIQGTTNQEALDITTGTSSGSGVGFRELGQSFTLSEDTSITKIGYLAGDSATFSFRVRIYAGQTISGTPIYDDSPVAVTTVYGAYEYITLTSPLVATAGVYTILLTENNSTSFTLFKTTSGYSGGQAYAIGFQSYDFVFQVWTLQDVVTNELIADGTTSTTTGGIDANSEIRSIGQSASGLSRLGNNATGGYFTAWSAGGEQTALVRSYATGGVQAFFTAGNVGIGTASPGGLLNLGGGVDSPDILLSNAQTGLTDSGKIRFKEEAAGPDRFVIRHDGSANKLIFDTESASNALVIDRATGNVGIGTASPKSKLDIGGDELRLGLLAGTDNSATFRMLEERASYENLGGYFQYDGTNNRFVIGTTKTDNIDYPRITIHRDNGNVGIGTTSPDNILHTKETGVHTRIHSESTNAYSAGFKMTNNEGGFTLATDAGGLYIYDMEDSAYRLNIDTTGNVGIGATSPTGVLDIKKDTASPFLVFDRTDNANVGNQLQMGISSNGANLDYAYFSSTSVTSLLALQLETGKVGIGVTTPPKTLTVDYTNGETNIAGNGLPGGSTGVGILIENRSSTANTYASLDFRSYTGDARIAARTTGVSNEVDMHFILDSTSGFVTPLYLSHLDRVGIGTTSPSALLSVRTNNTALHDEVILDLTGEVIGSGAGGNERSILLGKSDSPGRQAKIAYDQGNSNGQIPSLSFWTGDSASALAQHMTILSSGNVGIGVTSPNAKLSVIDTASSSTDYKFFVGRQTNEGMGIAIDDNGTYIDHIQDETGTEAHHVDNDIISTATGTKFYRWMFNGTERVRINHKGSGTATSQNGTLKVTGDIQAYAGVFATSIASAGNWDHIWNDDTANAWHFCNDTTYKGTGNSKIVAGTANLNNLPTSASGLSAGDIWNNSGVLNIV